MRPPRAALTMMTPGLVLASWSLAIRPAVSGVFGRCTVMKSARSRSSSRVTSSIPSCAARRRHVGVVRDDLGLERGQAGGNQLADTAEADDADGLVEQLDTVERGTLPGVVLERRVRGGHLTGHRHEQRDGMFGSGWMFDVGALTTITPRAVAASMSTLSGRRRPGRRSSAGAAASTSASTVVAERTSTASASTTASKQLRAVRTVDPPHLDVVAECLDGRRANLSAIRTTGRPAALTCVSLTASR